MLFIPIGRAQVQRLLVIAGMALELRAQEVGEELMVAIVAFVVERSDEQIALAQLLQDRLAGGPLGHRITQRPI